MERFQADLDTLSRDILAISKNINVSKCDNYHQEVRRVSKYPEEPNLIKTPSPQMLNPLIEESNQ
jgi:hypothetical protein